MSVQVFRQPERCTIDKSSELCYKFMTLLIDLLEYIIHHNGLKVFRVHRKNEASIKLPVVINRTHFMIGCMSFARMISLETD